MDISDIRRFRLRKLIHSKFAGVSARLAEQIDKQPSYVARIFSSNPAHARNIGERLAREIERACGLEEGHLDLPLTKAEVTGELEGDLSNRGTRYEPNPASLRETIFHLERSSSDEYTTIHRLPFAPLMGPGESITLENAWLRKNVTFTELENLWLLSNVGDSMVPSIHDGDLMLVDNGVSKVDFDAVYVFGMNGTVHVKRIQIGLDGLRVISDNERYGDLLIPNDRVDEIKIGARVVYSWNGKSF